MSFKKNEVTIENNNEETNELDAQMKDLMAGTSGNNNQSLTDILGGFDLSNKLIPINDENGQPIEYEWLIKSAKMTTAKTGSQMLTLGLVNVYPEKTDVYVNDNCVFTKEAIWKFKSLASSLGLLSEDGSAFIGTSEQDFVGQIVSARIRHDEFEGESRVKIAGKYVPAKYSNKNIEFADDNETPSFG